MDSLHLRLLDVLSADVVRSLDSSLRASRMVEFFVEHAARAAQIWLADGRGELRIAASAGIASADTASDRLVEYPLVAHGTNIGFLRLTDVNPSERATEFLARLVEFCSFSLYNARMFEHEQLVSLTFQSEAMSVDLPAIPGVTFDAVYEAGRAEALVGGDWYDAFLLHDGRFVVSVGDVAGSGINAAVTMVNVRQTVRGIAYVHADPILMMRGAEATLRSQYPGRFVTAFVAVIDPVTQTCSYVNAGHPPPLLRTADGGVRSLAGRSLPLGLHEFDDGLEAHHTAIESNSLLVLYTDGLTEATRNPIEGEERVRSAIASIDPTSAAAARQLHDQVLPSNARDDVAILTMHFQAPLPVRRWRFDPRWADVARRARVELLEELCAGGLGERARFDAEMIFAELLANLIRYAEGVIEIFLERRSSHFILHVVDKGPGFEFSPRLPSDLFSERGRGLFLIAQLAREFTVERRPGGGSHARITLSNGE